MTRKLKLTMLVAAALTASAVVSVSASSAAEYHCDIPTGSFCKFTVRADGSGKTAHHVFDVKKGAFSGAVTCAGFDAEGTMAKTATEATVTNLVYTECNLAGTPATIDTKGCDYLFKANGGAVNVVCEAGKTIKITASECVVEIGSQALTGITYTNVNPLKKEVTASALIKNVAGVASIGCLPLVGFSGAFSEGEYTTGNALVKAYRDELGEEGPQVSGWWE